MPEPLRYRWQNPYAWLHTACSSWDKDRLLLEVRRLAIEHDSDTLQDLYQQDMDDDGYFDPIAPAQADDDK